MSIFVERIKVHFRKEIEPIKIQLNGIDIVVSEPSDYNLSCIFFSNMGIAEGNGYYPTSLGSILNQLEEEEIPNMVLFDTPSKHFPGNDWRIIDIDQNKKNAVIRFYGIFGNHDLKGVEDVTLPIDKTFFTGVSIQKITIDGEEATLDEVVARTEGQKGYGDSVKHISETIYLSMLSTKRLQTNK